MNTIQILTTGGTIDKIYNPLNGELEFPEHTQVPEMLEEARLNVPYELGQLMMVDSLDMTEEQRQEILVACQESPHDRIVITHGTDTMPETARVLDAEIDEKTIVLLGAMRPYSMGRSDALFNLGTAIMASQIVSGGVHVAMNGRIFGAKQVAKDRSIGQFTAREA